MPIWLRNWTFGKMNEFYEEQNEKSKGKKTLKNPPKGPGIRQPSYSTKARK